MAIGGLPLFVLQGVVEILTKGAEQSLRDVDKASQGSEKALGALETQAQRSKQRLAELEQAARDSEAGLSKIDVAARNAAQAQEAFQRASEAAAQSAKSGFEAMADSALRLAGPGVLGALSGAILKVAADGIAFGRDVSSSMKDFQIATGASADEARDFGQALAELKGDNLESVKEIGGALTEVTRQFHLAGEEARQTTQEMLEYARVTGQDAGKATQDMGVLLRSWGLGARDAGLAADVLTRGAQLSGHSTKELSDTLTKSATAFQAMGLNVQQAAGYVTEFARQGVSGTSVLTALKTLATSAEAPTKKAAAAFADLGIAVDGAGKPIGGAKAVLEQLTQQLASGELPATKFHDVLDLLGKKGGDVARALGASGDEIKQFTAELENAQGTVEKANDVEEARLGNRVQLLYQKYFQPAIQFIGDLSQTALGKLLDLVEYLLGAMADAGTVLFNMTVNVGGAFAKMGAGIKDMWNDVVAYIERTVADMIDKFDAAFSRLPGVLKEKLGIDKDLLKDGATSAALRADADQRTSGRVGPVASGGELFGQGVKELFGPIGGETNVTVQDVVRKKKGPLQGKPIFNELKAGDEDEVAAAATKKRSAALEHEIKLLEHQIQIEKISKEEGIKRIDALIAKTKEQQAAEKDAKEATKLEQGLFSLENERHRLVKQIAAEKKKNEAEAERERKKNERERKRQEADAKRAREERFRDEKSEIDTSGKTNAEKIAALEQLRAKYGDVGKNRRAIDQEIHRLQAEDAKKLAQEQAKQRQEEFKAAIETAKVKGQVHREALLQLQQQVEEMRKNGVSEQQIAELVAAKKKQLLADQVKEEEAAISKIERLRKGESDLDKGGDFTLGGVMSLEDAFKAKPEDQKSKKDAKKKELAPGDLTKKDLEGLTVDNLATLAGAKGSGKAEKPLATSGAVGGTAELLAEQNQKRTDAAAQIDLWRRQHAFQQSGEAGNFSSAAGPAADVKVFTDKVLGPGPLPSSALAKAVKTPSKLEQLRRGESSLGKKETDKSSSSSSEPELHITVSLKGPDGKEQTQQVAARKKGDSPFKFQELNFTTPLTGLP